MICLNMAAIPRSLEGSLTGTCPENLFASDVVKDMVKGERRRRREGEEGQYNYMTSGTRTQRARVNATEEHVVQLLSSRVLGFPTP
jgi:hypothetical protein